MLLIDELWILADVKAHRFEGEAGADRIGYTNVTIGGEVGWPNVYSSAGSGVTIHDAAGKALLHAPMAQGLSGFFGNVLLGWAFDP